MATRGMLTGRWLALAVGATFALGCLTACIGSDSEIAKIACEDAVKQHFNSGTDAEILSNAFHSDGEEKWSGSGQVEVNGASGVRETHSFDCTVKYDSDNDEYVTTGSVD